MTETKTRFDGIIIRTEASDSKSFIGQATAALDMIYDKPVGQALIDGIVAKVGSFKSNFLVRIEPNASVKHKIGPLIRWRTYTQGSATRAATDQRASDGTGTVSRIRWDPKTVDTPDGARPPFIALAHELIHCFHNLNGTSYLITGDSGLKTDEMRVTGLQGYEQEPISENRIRQEHGLPYRSSYHGKCSKAEGQPDVAKF